ncbi:MAG: hypothetical protein ACR2PK_13695 [Acidimicrobiales bacterium]
MRSNLTRLMGVLFAIALVAAACGDDDSATATDEGGETQPTATETEPEPAVEDGDGTEDDGEDSHMDDQDHDHDHGDGIEVAAGLPVPEVAVEVTPDPAKGQNLQVALQNFEVTPENASTEAVDGEGHLHLYVDGERVLRFYNEWLHLELEPGEHTIDVEVSANDHRPYTVDGEPIRATTTVVVPEPEADAGHSHAEMLDVAVADAPVVSVEVFEDPKKGWNIQAIVESFEITPENASTAHVDGEGHLHLLVDGQRVTRLYGEWWHLAELTEGDHVITVEVATNDHRLYALEGEPIVGQASLFVPADKATPPPDNGDQGEMPGADLVINIGFANGVVDVVDDRIGVDRDSVVALVVSSDVDEHVHVHGYDIFVDVSAGEEEMIMFDADVPGVFEVEFEDSLTFITELEVS